MGICELGYFVYWCTKANKNYCKCARAHQELFYCVRVHAPIIVQSITNA